jgi:hypothetical protein
MLYVYLKYILTTGLTQSLVRKEIIYKITKNIYFYLLQYVLSITVHKSQQDAHVTEFT